MIIKQVKKNTKEAIDFLLLPQLIYPANELMESSTEIQSLLNGTHPLSTSIIFEAFIGYIDHYPIIRAALIYNHNTNNYYLGYFEAMNNLEVMQEFIEYIRSRALSLGATRIIGPVNGSFWINYRMKLDHFDKPPFTSEPHNPAYYPKLWESVGFKLVESYRSNYYQIPPRGYRPKKLKQRYGSFVKRSYQFINPDKKNWGQVIMEVYSLLTKLYQDFPFYERITADQFKELFKSYAYILDFSIVDLVYKNNELVGFFIVLPDYGNQVYKALTPINLLKILLTRHKAKTYILLYLGVAPQHLGLGSALSYRVLQKLKDRQAKSIGAIIHQGKITDYYLTNMQIESTEYGIYELIL